MRYRLLETVREYALHHLEQSHEAAAVRRSHLRWCRQLAEAWDAAFFGPGQAARLAGLVAELDTSAPPWTERWRAGRRSRATAGQALGSWTTG